MITIQLTKEHAETLYGSLQLFENAGPMGEGWASDDIEEFLDILGAAIEAQP